MSIPSALQRGALLCAIAAMLSGCLAVAATTAVVGVAGAVVGTGVKATGAVIGAVIPGDGKKNKKD